MEILHLEVRPKETVSEGLHQDLSLEILSPIFTNPAEYSKASVATDSIGVLSGQFCLRLGCSKKNGNGDISEMVKPWTVSMDGIVTVRDGSELKKKKSGYWLNY